MSIPLRRPGPPDPLAALSALPGVLDAADEARGAVDRLLVHRVLRRQIPAVAGESTLRGARAAAVLAGAEVELAELRSAPAEDPIVRGAVRAYAALGALIETWTRAPGQVLARLHSLAAADLVSADELGRPRAAPEVAARLRGLGELVAGDGGTPAVILAAVVHGELAALAPFGSADRVVACAAARLTMRSRGLDTNGVSVPEVGMLETAQDYHQALAGFSAGTEEGMRDWLRWFGEAVTLGAREGTAVCEALLRSG